MHVLEQELDRNGNSAVSAWLVKCQLCKPEREADSRDCMFLSYGEESHKSKVLTASFATMQCGAVCNVLLTHKQCVGIWRLKARHTQTVM